MRKKFDLQEYLAHPDWRVETDAQEPVTIIKTDLVNDDGNILCYYHDGREEIPYVTRGDSLFLVTPEPELTEFEQKLAEWMYSGCDLEGMLDVEGEDGVVTKTIKHAAKELSDLARKEIVNGWQKGMNELQDRSGKAYADGYTQGFKTGQAEALKDLPRWKKASEDIFTDTLDYAVLYPRDGGDHEDWYSVEVTNRLRAGEYYFELSYLTKLPKE